MDELAFLDVSGNQTGLSASDLDSLQSAISGRLLPPDHSGYDQARIVWNAMVDQRPGLIVQCSDTDDVVAAVKFARAHDLLVSIRSGGHNIAGKSVADASFCIDLSQMKVIDVNTVNNSVKCQPGLNLGELDQGTQAHNLATVLGIATDTGMAGVAIGGGYGWLAGKYGMTCDNLLSAELVLADGEVVTASAEENEDLFWGIRGGGGNFGIVTSFEFQLHPVTTVWGGAVVHPRSEAVAFLQFFREFAANAPDELTLIGLIMSTPDGEPAVGAAACYSGPDDLAEKVLKPLRDFGSPLVDGIDRVPYIEHQKLLDEGWPPGDNYYWKTSLISDLTDDAVSVMVEQANQAPGPLSLIALQQLHGAAARVPPTQTAFAHRYDHYDFIPMARWTAPDEAVKQIQWARETWEAMQPYYDEGVYGNDLNEGEDDRVGNAYGVNQGRLVELKNRYDPNNFFRLNQNIEPTS